MHVLGSGAGKDIMMELAKSAQEKRADVTEHGPAPSFSILLGGMGVCVHEHMGGEERERERER